MISTSEKKLYKVLRNVGVKKRFIAQAETIEDLYLDDFDFKLLVYYFEGEFEVQLRHKDIKKLTTLSAFHNYLNHNLLPN